MTMRTLTAQAAQITTASVEIRALTVSGKQVTLAVFRQLIDEDIITHDGSLSGIPWGTVNYHPDGCSGGDEHFHVVWQNGMELRRANVRKRLSTHLFGADSDIEFLQAFFGDLKSRQMPPMRCYLRNGKVQADAIAITPTSYKLTEIFEEDQFFIELENFCARTEWPWEHQIGEERRRIHRLRHQIDSLQALPQLFIAV